MFGQLSALTIVLLVAGGDAFVTELPRVLSITVDGNLVDVCINGVRVPQSETPNANDVATIDTILLPPSGGVLAVKANNGNPKFVGLVASDTSGQLVSNSSWRCHVNARPDQDWCATQFDDSGWAPAVQVALYGSDKRGKIAGDVFDPRSYWIWTSTDPSNNGIVYCRAGIPAAAGGSGGSGQVQPPAIISGTPQSVTRIVGEPLTIYGIASGATDQSAWTKAGLEVSSDPAIHIGAVAATDAGLYQTTYSNAGGSAAFTTTATILVPPVLSGNTEVIYPVNVGDAVVFNNVDVIAGDPTPSVTWYKDGIVVPVGTPASATRADEGTYTVIAENAAGSAVHFAVVKVAPPALVIGPASPATVTRHAGTTATLFCAVSGGDPCDRATVTWAKDGVHFNGNDGSLVAIQSVTVGDAGSYLCTYSDKGGRSVSWAIQLNVIEAPVIQPPYVEDLVVRGGTGLCLTCPLAKGTAPVAEAWYRDGLLQPAASPYCPSPVDYTSIGTYVCLKSNAIGDDVKYDYVNVSVLNVATYKSDFINTALTNLAATKQFLFQLKAVGGFRLALTRTQGVYTNNEVYVLTLGADSNSAITLGKAVTGKNPKIDLKVSAAGVLSPTEFRWFWISVPAAGSISLGSGTTVGQQQLLSYTYTDGAFSPCCVGVASVAGGSAVVFIYP